MRFSDLSPEEQAASWARTQDTLARVDKTNAELAAREIPSETWQPPEPQPTPTPQPRPAVRRAPPMPDKVQLVRHDPATGRAIALITYEGHMSITKVIGWEDWVQDQIQSAVKKGRQTTCEWVGDALGIILKEERAATAELIERRIEAALERQASGVIRKVRADALISPRPWPRRKPWEEHDAA